MSLFPGIGRLGGASPIGHGLGQGGISQVRRTTARVERYTDLHSLQPPDAKILWLDNVETGAWYAITIGYRYKDGRPTKWSGTIYHRVVGNSSPPAPPLSVQVKGGVRSATLTWEAPNVVDFRGVLVWSNTASDFPGGDGILVPSAPGATSIWVDSDIDAGATYYYWLASVDVVGNKSSVLGPYSVTTTSLSATDVTYSDATPVNALRPAEPASDKTINQLGGNGINLLPRLYNDFELGVLPPLFVTNGVSVSIVRGGYNDGICLQIARTAAEDDVFFSSSHDSDNILLDSDHPEVIFSCRIKSDVVNMPLAFTLYHFDQVDGLITTSDIAVTTPSVASTWMTVSGVFDTSVFDNYGSRAVLVMKCLGTSYAGATVRIDKLMLEHKIGNLSTPSPFSYSQIAPVSSYYLGVPTGLPVNWYTLPTTSGTVVFSKDITTNGPTVYEVSTRGLKFIFSDPSEWVEVKVTASPGVLAGREWRSVIAPIVPVGSEQHADITTMLYAMHDLSTAPQTDTITITLIPSSTSIQVYGYFQIDIKQTVIGS